MFGSYISEMKKPNVKALEARQAYSCIKVHYRILFEVENIISHEGNHLHASVDRKRIAISQSIKNE